ncbi:phage scaffolding protein [Sporosarcina sp. Te-1]|uniref:phage scaffolding protein n=1 Tax=Sporosarcina sp. Te-1 TaxID=2818390 RepID=UPI001A9F6062|nr:phage scaffolding protein [Sporosarcina sp. Te-1]QTD40643.1 phage scaffolding protein [Sporosarcina sp. Te-1]
MKRRFLEGLGLGKEKIDSIMSVHGKTLESHKAKAAKLQTSLEEQLYQRNKDIENLKGNLKRSEEFQRQLARLEELQLITALKLALKGEVYDVDMVIERIDLEKIKLDTEGNVAEGFDEQIKLLQKSKPFLFIPEDNTTSVGRGMKPTQRKPENKLLVIVNAEFF